MASLRTIRRFVGYAVRQAPGVGLTPAGLLEQAIDRLTAEQLEGNGTVVVSTGEAGGSVSFQIPAGQSPMEFADVLQECLDWVNMQADPANPVTTGRRIMRLRASFAKAVIS